MWLICFLLDYTLNMIGAFLEGHFARFGVD